MGARIALINNSTVQGRIKSLYLPCSFFVLGVLLLFPPLLTVHVEQRWLLEPFIIVLLLFAWALNKENNKRDRSIFVLLAFVLSFTSILIDSYTAQHFSNIFFVSSGRFAKIVKQDIIDKDLGNASPIVILANESHCKWTLLNGGFFRLYDKAHRKIYCYGAEDVLAGNLLLPDKSRIYVVNPTSFNFNDVTSDWLQILQPSGEKIYFDFLKAFEEGHINDTTKISTPNGQGVIMLPWDTSLGPQKTLTVISGFSYQYDNLQINPNSKLRFGLSMIYPSRESARAIVRIKEEGKQLILFNGDLKPPIAGAQLRFDPIIISLADFSGKKNVSITFSVETTPGKDKSGHWIGFANPRISADEVQ